MYINRNNFISQIIELYLSNKESIYFNEAFIIYCNQRPAFKNPKITIPSNRGSMVTMMSSISNWDQCFRFYIAYDSICTSQQKVGDLFINLNKNRNLENFVIVLDMHSTNNQLSYARVFEYYFMKIIVFISFFNPIKFC